MRGLFGVAMKTASFEVALKGKKQIADGTWAFVFEKPEGFHFKAGQHVRITLIDPSETDGAGNSRFFSLASTPQDSDLTIAMRLRDTAFKRTLRRMQIGDKVRVQILLDVPHRAFALHGDSSRPAVFIVGGIGVVPAFSMIKDAAERKLPHKMFLFYSSRRPEDASYLEELEKLSEQNPSFQLIVTVTAAEKSTKPWKGETGRITHSMLAKHVEDPLLPIFYISGLPKMVSAMKTMLGDSGVGEDRILAEEFSGFSLNEIHGGAGHMAKRLILMAAAVLAVIAAVVLHAAAGVAIGLTGLGGLLSLSASYAVIGLFLALALFKIGHVAGLYLVGRAFLGRRFGWHGTAIGKDRGS